MDHHSLNSSVYFIVIFFLKVLLGIIVHIYISDILVNTITRRLFYSVTQLFITGQD